MNQEICRLGTSKVTEDMVVGINPGELKKKYAWKMEFLGKMWEWSEKEVVMGIRYVKPLPRT